MRIRDRVAVIAGLGLAVVVSGSAALDALPELVSPDAAESPPGSRAALGTHHLGAVAGEAGRGSAHVPAVRRATGSLVAADGGVAAAPARNAGAAAVQVAAGEPAGPEAPVAAIALDAPQFENGTARFTGADPGGPRELVLWRVEPGASGLIARGASRADGSLDLPVLRVPSAGFDVVASPAGEPPTGPSASAPRRLAGREPDPPQARVVEAVGGRHRLQISPLEAAGAVVLAGPDEIEFARESIPEQPDAAARHLELWIEVPAEDAFVLLAHLLPDGRRSEWRPVALTGGDPGDVD
jgi:hypothetical protein